MFKCMSFLEYSHPDFVVEKQYIELCQGLPEYFQFHFHDVSMVEDLHINSVQVSWGVGGGSLSHSKARIFLLVDLRTLLL